MQHANNENHAAGGAQVLDSMQRRVIKGYELALAVISPRPIGGRNEFYVAYVRPPRPQSLIEPSSFSSMKKSKVESGGIGPTFLSPYA